MTKYQVENKIDNARQYAGEEPHSDITDDYVGDYIEADSPEEAISFAIDYLAEQIRANNVHYDVQINYDNPAIMVCDDEGNVVERYYNFCAIKWEDR